MRKRLLLVGGGHAHLFVLEALHNSRQEWRDRLDVTLVSSAPQLTYSGMLPGLVAGHYRPSECHLDLAPLAQRAGVAWVQGTIRTLDPVNNLAYCVGPADSAARDSGQGIPEADAGAVPMRFDMVSLDVGSMPSFSDVPGAADHAVGLKPAEQFLHRWRTLQADIVRAAHPLHVVTVGGGPGGVEVALAMAHRMADHRSRVKWSLVTRGRLLSGYSARAARLLERRLAAAGIAVRPDTDVARVGVGRIDFRDGSGASFDALLWATGAAPQEWIAASGLACVDGGFVQVNDRLQSVSHPHVFAAGDAATDPDHRRPKAGVFAVRQGPVLARNLMRFAVGGALASYIPQHDYLSLISTGARHAVASWYGLAWQGEWVWRWKDRIDRRFIDRFSVSDPPAGSGR